MLTFKLSQEELVAALTDYLLATGRVNTHTQDGIMSFKTNDDGILEITIMPILILDD